MEAHSAAPCVPVEPKRRAKQTISVEPKLRSISHPVLISYSKKSSLMFVFPLATSWGLDVE